MKAQSPISVLEDAVRAAAQRIAPENIAALESVSHSLKIENTTNFKFSVTDTDICTNYSSLEYLWCSCLFHFVLYDEYATAQSEGENTFDFNENERRKNAVLLLKWAKNKLSGGSEEWPQNLPRPCSKPNQLSDEHVTNELFLISFAWVIHHEIAHIRLEHSIAVAARSQQEEKDADLSAVVWILDNCESQPEYRKRAYGVVAAILAIHEREKGNADAFGSHPTAFTRLDNCLSKIKIGPDDEIYAFAGVILQIHLAYLGKDTAHNTDTFREMLDEYLFEFARFDS
jgi:hypothetical protein